MLIRSVALLCVVSLSAMACGGSSPTGPAGPATSGSVDNNTYVAEMALPGGATGMLTLRASSSLALHEPAEIPVLSRLLEWLEPAVAAQSSPASGLLVTSTGQSISLSGTFSGGTFNVSGAGYTIVATVTNTPAGTSISGTAMVPGGGTVPVTAPAPLPVTGPSPANPVGTYAGTFHIETQGTQINRRASDNVVVQDCSFNVVIDGTLSLRLFNVLSNGLVQSELTSSWTESGAGTVSPTCGTGPANSWGTISPGQGLAAFEGPPSSLVYGHAGPGPNPPAAGTITRAETYLGAVSGNTVVMRVSRSFQFVNQLNTAQNGLVNSVMGYPTVSVTITLTKQ